MFAPDGFVPFAVAQRWILERADEFYRECALPWAARLADESDDADAQKLFRTAFAGRMIFLEWLVDTCLYYQPVAVYPASPGGDIMRVGNQFFEAEDHLSWYDFQWPLLDDELRPIAESGAVRETLDGRFEYYFWDRDNCCIRIPEVEECRNLPAQAGFFLDVALEFDGWSVCFKHEDCDTLETILVRLYDWTGERTAPSLKGRPRKQEVAASIYASLYPEGHEVRGHTWLQVADSVGKAGGISVSVDTLRRGLAQN
ncbi:hypothetical protein DEM26_16615 [Thioclava sp. NG1]|uniref:hypothetical protein n=1 Tax=Thioclava sp. NG1 TaxID=2182426 RepID=UPI000D61C27A|nr:hypothetical protein [Thioclava sp. NG1]PWE48720.1 hypothetical protein DEM26_16615 [Thioclava sp. NG1]